MDRKCLTSGMILHTKFEQGKIIIEIDVPCQNWDRKTAEIIDDRLHDSIEYAIAPYWN